MTLKEAISGFGLEARAKLTNPGASGAPEDQLRAPLETLIANLAGLTGLPSRSIVAVGESSLAKDIRVYSSEEVELWRDSSTHVLGRALREGRTLYERP